MQLDPNLYPQQYAAMPNTSEYYNPPPPQQTTNTYTYPQYSTADLEALKNAQLTKRRGRNETEGRNHLCDLLFFKKVVTISI